MNLTIAGSAAQKGQALILMLAFTLVLSVALIYLFNTSQVLAERTQAKVLADHAAYNMATKQAQLLNANAYMNKAKIANQLATAQAVSVASWVEHFEPFPQNTARLNLIPGVGNEIHAVITESSQALQELEPVPAPFIAANNLATGSISVQQSALNRVSLKAILDMPEVTLQNSSMSTGFESTPLMTSQYAVSPNNSFIKLYSGDSRDPNVGRARLKDVVLASRDDFTRERRADNTTDFNIPVIENKLVARGGTEISDDLNQWKGVDTFSHWLRVPDGLFSWKRIEDQIGYGSAVVRTDNKGDNDASNNAGYDGANFNRDASRLSAGFTPKWDSRRSGAMRVGETGVPQFWDLDSDFLSQEEPTLPVAIRISKASNELNTTTGISEFKVGDELDITTDDGVTAISTAEVYFERPLQDRRGASTYFNKGRIEKASLLNPYWNVRLTNNSPETVTEASLR